MRPAPDQQKVNERNLQIPVNCCEARKVGHLTEPPHQQRLADEQLKCLDKQPGEQTHGNRGPPIARPGESNVLPSQPSQSQRGPPQQEQVGNLAKKNVMVNIRNKQSSNNRKFREH
jgi:hypothetical protein